MSDKKFTTRFIVHRSTLIHRKGVGSYALVFLTPLFPRMEDTPPDEGDPVADVLWEAELDATPHEFAFTADQTDAMLGYRTETGIEIQMAEPLEVDTIVDVTVAVIGKRNNV